MTEGLILPELYDSTPTTRRRAKLFTLKEHPLAGTRSAPSIYTADDMWELLYARFRLRRPIRVWAARSADEAIQTNQEIKQSKQEVSFNFFKYPEHVKRCSLILYASRTEEAVEGVLACSRTLLLAEDYVTYGLDMDLIYVTPKARRKSVSTALKTSLVEIVTDDLDRLVRIGRRARRKIPIRVGVYGDIESDEGERAINEVYQLITDYGEVFEDYPIDFDSDWGW